MNGLVQLLTGLTVLAVMGAVTVTDPTGDSVGDGTIVAPAAPRYANSAIFDLQDVNLASVPAAPAGTAGSIVLLPAEPAEDLGAGSDADASEEPSPDAEGEGAVGDDETLTDVRSVLRLTLGAIDVSETTALGFGSVVVDVYLDVGPGGRAVTLDGPGMLLPSGRGWEYALRLSPDGARGYVYVEPEVSTETGTPADLPEEAVSDGDDAVVEDPVQEVLPASPVFDRVPVGFALEGATLVIETPWELPADVTVYALTGVHDPFNPTGWRPLAESPSPWAYSGGDQVVPVVDLLAPDQETQERALRTGVLPLPAVPTRDSGALWLALMGLGLAVAIAGLVMRRQVPGPAKQPLRTGLPPEPQSVIPTPSGPKAAAPPGPVADEPSDQPPTEDDQADQDAGDVSVVNEDEELAPEPVEVVAPPEPGGVRELTNTTRASVTSRTPNGGADAPGAYSGVSAFDSYVLYEDAVPNDQDDDGFEELTDAVVKPVPSSHDEPG